MEATVLGAINAGWSNVEWILNDPDLASLRDDPEFKRLTPAGKP